MSNISIITVSPDIQPLRLSVISQFLSLKKLILLICLFKFFREIQSPAPEIPTFFTVFFIHVEHLYEL